ncbi:uncharacterized protein LOC143190134 isoform X2 [Rhynchophorus ferrugineus]|uniref:uncharacterized protein LOC143190134 isoform X2 n=1 Tax=Rhynchophorus ferrugineus TaxID=354439 RepID=UPI003FCE93A7
MWKMATYTRSLLWLSLAFAFVNSQQIIPFGSFQRDIAFPAATRTVQVAAQLPIEQRQISAGINFNPPATLPLVQLPLSSVLLPVRSGYEANNVSQRLPTPPSFNLFVPNTVKQQPHTKGQEEEYRKYLKEGEEEAEKERKQNDITSVFDQTTSTLKPIPVQRTFVSVNLQGNNYSYTT